MNQIIAAVLSAYKRTKSPFSCADVVHCVNEGSGANTATRASVLAALRAHLKAGQLKSTAVSSPQGYGWMYHAVDLLVLPEGFSVRAAEVQPTTVKRGRASAKKSSQDWLISKGWELPEEASPAGWDLTNFYASFFEELIDEQEFMRRWNFSYDPAEKLEIPEEFYKAFITQMIGTTGVTTLDMTSSIQDLCLDKPDIETVVTKLRLNNVLPGIEVAQVVNAAESCKTIGELLSVSYQAKQNVGTVATP